MVASFRVEEGVAGATTVGAVAIAVMVDAGVVDITPIKSSGATQLLFLRGYICIILLLLVIQLINLNFLLFLTSIGLSFSQEKLLVF